MTTPEENEELLQQAAIAGQAGQIAQSAAAAQYYTEEKEKSIAEAQLEVEVTLEKLYHLLKQDVFRDVDKGRMDWVAITDDKKRVLTDEGVDRIMQTMSFYINKENLLSNFSETQINNIMLTFRLALNANFFMRYNTIFRQPSFEECKAILENRLKEQKEIKKYAIEMLGEKPDEEKIKQEVFKEVENRIEKEIQKIKEEKRKENLREWELLFEQLSQMILATLNRAWKGEERGSLRRHTNISEVLGRTSPIQKEGGMFKWIKR
ncbi:MAG TPA: hypothetical protein VMX17_08830 [Candidatus Glassbacteria bacterium]|nr:hypothetical protein [Candidatus Glassbacteria bacterium]